MDNRKTSQGFAKVSIGVLKYVVMVVLLIVFATTAFNFGAQVFSTEGVDPEPGTDMTFTVEDGTSIKEFGEMLEEFRVIKDSKVFRVQSFVYSVKEIKPGTYTFNTSQGSEEIFDTITSGPEEDKKEEETTAQS